MILFIKNLLSRGRTYSRIVQFGKDKIRRFRWSIFHSVRVKYAVGIHNPGGCCLDECIDNIYTSLFNATSVNATYPIYYGSFV